MEIECSTKVQLFDSFATKEYFLLFPLVIIAKDKQVEHLHLYLYKSVHLYITLIYHKSGISQRILREITTV